MAKKAGLGIAGVVVLALLLWWFLSQDASPAAALAADVASGKQVQIPEFGTDNIIDAADAVSITGSLPLPTLTLAPSTVAVNSSQ